MGRLTKRHKFLTSEVRDSLLEPENIQRDLQIGLNVLESYRKSRNPVRKKRFKQELTNVLKRMCLQYHDETTEAQKKIQELEERLREKDDRAQVWKNRSLKLEMKISDSMEYRRMYEDQKKSNRTVEADIGVLCRENDRLKERIEELKKQNKALKKVAKSKKTQPCDQ